MRAFRSGRGWRRVVVVGVALGGALAVGGSLAGAGEPGTAAAGARAERQEALVELGRRLFFDPKASRTGARSCAACHDPVHGFSDPDTVSDDELGPTRRHSQTLLDSARNPNAHWDGEFESVAELVMARVGAIPGGNHGFGGGLTSKAEQRERGRRAREAAARPTGSGTPTGGATPGTPPPAPPASGNSGSGGEPASSGGGGGEQASGEGNAPVSPGGTPGETTTAPPVEGATGGPEGAGGTAAGGPPPSPTYGGPPRKVGGSVAPGLRNPQEPSDAPPAPNEPSDPPPSQPQDAAPPGGGGGEAERTGAPSGTSTPGTKPETPAEEERKRREDEQAQIDAVARLPRVSDVLAADGRYREAFHAAFGSELVSDTRIAEAVEAYVHTIESTPSAYDRYVAGAADALTPLARQGLALFRGRAGCAQCHVLEGKEAPLTDYAFHNTGIVWRQVPADTDLTVRKLDALLDAGRQGISTKPAERRAFKTPTLRDVSLRAPYMHDASLRSLDEVVKHYAAGGSHDPKQDARIRPFEITEQETGALVAFLESLTGTDRPGKARSTWGRRAPETVLKLVDVRGRALPGVRVRLVPVGDALPVVRAPAVEIALTTDEDGCVVYTPPHGFTHMSVVLPAAMGRLPEEWIPDSSRQATVRVPVLGKFRVVLTTSDARELPDTLAVSHPGAAAKPGQPEPRTALVRTGAVTGNAGPKTALYAGWVRADLPSLAHLRVPGRERRPPIELRLEPSTTLSFDLR